MSDQRPEWMPTFGELMEATAGDDNDGDGFPCSEALILRTGLRAQIAAFKWLREDAGDMMTNALSDWLQSREEALRKELGE